jgi:hypothetical protein
MVGRLADRCHLDEVLQSWIGAEGAELDAVSKGFPCGPAWVPASRRFACTRVGLVRGGGVGEGYAAWDVDALVVHPSGWFDGVLVGALVDLEVQVGAG